MQNAASHQITLLLVDWSKGDEFALEQLIPLVYEELRQMARRHMRGQSSEHTFRTTELIHEAYLKIAKGKERNWENRAHFFGVASQAMRHILVDYARSKQSRKRGDWQERITLADHTAISDNKSKGLVALDDALNILAALDECKNWVVELKYFGGLTIEEIAEVLKISPETVNRDFRSSVFRYKGKETNAQTVAKELDVQAVLTGKVRQRGNELSLYIELVDAATEKAIWSQPYNRPMTNLVSLQTEIARDVSQKLKTKLSGADEQKLAKTYTATPEAYQLYLRGRFYWNKQTAEDLKRAIEQFKAAADLDPNYALAFVGLADSYLLLEQYTGTPPSETLPQARSYAERAVQIDEQLAEAHTSLAFVNYMLWQWAESEKEFKRAIELNPNYPTARHWYYIYLPIWDDSMKHWQRLSAHRSLTFSRSSLTSA